MIKLVRILATMMVALFATSAMAFTPPPSPKPSNILDQAHILTPNEFEALNNRIDTLNRTSANEVGILIVPSLNGENIRDVGFATARAWGVGKKDLDNGVLIVWSTGDRKIDIETGKGIEGDLPDLKSNDIITTIMRPAFRNGQYFSGLSKAVDAISSNIEDHRAQLAARDRQNAVNPHSSGGCDVSGAPMTRAGLGDVLGLLLVITGIYLVVRNRSAARRKLLAQQEALRQRRQQHDEMAQRLDQLLDSLPIPVEQPAPVATPPVYIPSPPVADPIATVATTTATAEVATRLLREREEVRQEQARLRELEVQRQERRAQEQAAILAAIVVMEQESSDNDDSDEPIIPEYSTASGFRSSDDDSSDDSSDSDDADSSFGGGDVSGGGSDDSY